MTKKLFYVEVTKSGWVLAENEIEAENFKCDILSTEDLMEVEVSDYSENLIKSSGWCGGCYIYHKDMKNGKDIMLSEVL
jgi:hypothetical protein